MYISDVDAPQGTTILCTILQRPSRNNEAPHIHFGRTCRAVLLDSQQLAHPNFQACRVAVSWILVCGKGAAIAEINLARFTYGVSM